MYFVLFKNLLKFAYNTHKQKKIIDAVKKLNKNQFIFLLNWKQNLSVSEEFLQFSNYKVYKDKVEFFLHNQNVEITTKNWDCLWKLFFT